MGYKNIAVLKGGLNQWFQDIILAKESQGPWDKKADEVYQFRKGAREYFGGGSSPVEETSAAPKAKKPVVKHKKKEVEGGCG
jgi:hypothetical protein